MSSNKLGICIATLAVLAGCAERSQPFEPVLVPALSGQPAPPDISGTWTYDETSHLVLKPGSDVLQITCLNPEGVLTIVQDGASFSGTLTHPVTTCQTKDGHAVPAPWDLPYEAVLTGRITGQALHIDQFDAPPGAPVHCPKNGALRVSGGVVVELRTTGRCDLSFLPFPAVAHNSAIATRP